MNSPMKKTADCKTNSPQKHADMKYKKQYMQIQSSTYLYTYIIYMSIYICVTWMYP